ncbi:MAG: response regulator [Bdellovibrionaceae bacterium]|nr:response regulator [Pseudobdellovibrionaceae bacterium]
MVRYIIADDAPFIHEIIKNVLPEDQFEHVGSGYNGNEAVELVKRTLPDLVFLDFVMPSKSGVEALGEIKQVWPDLKVIGVSTVDNTGILQVARRNGMDVFMEKPFTKDTLFQALNDVGYNVEAHQKMKESI